MNANSANKDLTSLRILFREFWAYEGEPKRDNPFADLRFKNVVYRTIPPFSAGWIETKLLADGALSGLKPEARLFLCWMWSWRDSCEGGKSLAERQISPVE